MNQTQKNYILSRLDSIVRVKLQAIKEAHTTPAIVLNFEERLKALETHAFVVKLEGLETHKIPNYSIKKYITFDAEQDQKVDQKTIDKETDMIKKEQVKTADSIMLGDSDHALKVLASFEKKCKV